MKLAALRNVLPDANSRDQLAERSRAVGRGIAEIRTLSFDLQLPWSEPTTSLESAVAQFSTGFGRRTGLKIVLNTGSGSGEFAQGKTALILIRVLQEALLNVYRHANARSVRVSFAFDGHTATLAVEDDGRGMRLVEGVPPGGGGLVGMRDRIRRLGGVLRIESGPMGTMVSACLPVPGH